MTPSPPTRATTTSDEAAPVKTQHFCNNCFKPADALYEDGQYPVCAGCLEKRQRNRAATQ